MACRIKAASWIARKTPLSSVARNRYWVGLVCSPGPWNSTRRGLNLPYAGTCGLRPGHQIGQKPVQVHPEHSLGSTECNRGHQTVRKVRWDDLPANKCPVDEGSQFDFSGRRLKRRFPGRKFGDRLYSRCSCHLKQNLAAAIGSPRVKRIVPRSWNPGRWFLG